MEIKNDILLEYKGGSTLSAAVLTAFARGITTLLDLGRSLGTAIRRSITGNICKL